jgi:prepilin-type N-terminal cleavage/methylation domain-containing protein
MKKLMNEKKNNNKGFTLVELIVVLVILAILAAILVPALLGYIDRAKQQQIVLNAKSCLTAAQAELSEMYAKDDITALKDTTQDDARSTRIIETALDNPGDCQALTIGCAAAFPDDKSKVSSTKTAYKITYVYYKQGGKEIYFDGSSWTETKPSDPTAPYVIVKATE